MRVGAPGWPLSALPSPGRWQSGAASSNPSTFGWGVIIYFFSLGGEILGYIKDELQ